MQSRNQLKANLKNLNKLHTENVKLKSNQKITNAKILKANQ